MLNHPRPLGCHWRRILLFLSPFAPRGSPELRPPQHLSPTRPDFCNRSGSSSKAIGCSKGTRSSALTVSRRFGSLIPASERHPFYSPSSNPPLVLLLEHIGRVQVEGWRGARVRTSEFGVAPVTDGHFFDVPVHDEVDERCAAEDAVGDEVAAEPVEAGTDSGADDDDRQSHLRIEIFAHVEIFAATHRTSIDRAIVADRFAD